MSRKIILNLAMSIDGYIACEDGAYDWIVSDGDETLDTENKFDFSEFLEGIDIVVMGKNCYDQNFHNDFKDKKVYVATTQDLKDHDNIHFINGDIVKITLEEKKQEGGDIFLFGGGILLDSFIKEDAIDEYIIGIIPTILGKGRRLFLENNP
ncbi:MAG: dihydrofolate reductase family protein, partial [Clostridium sp.]